jgi:hypothetical protein
MCILETVTNVCYLAKWLFQVRQSRTNDLVETQLFKDSLSFDDINVLPFALKLSITFE